MPKSISVSCYFCDKTFLISFKRFNEHKKLNWNFYCSVECLRNNRLNGQLLICDNQSCSRKFYRSSARINLEHNFCSRRCSAITNNTGGLRKKSLKKCGNSFCSVLIKHNRRYCSSKCFGVAYSFDAAQCINKTRTGIKKFYDINGRIPYKLELGNLYKIARKTFGTWNNAIIASGFSPNPVKFANRFIAKDGHKVDSQSEKIIDDWFYDHKIKHQVHVLYQANSRFSADFLVGSSLIEFFGIYGKQKRYTELANRKIALAKKLNINLIKLFPQDLKKLDRVLGGYLNLN